MSVDPSQMQAGAGAPPGGMPGQPPEAPPGAAPMLTPQQPKGAQAGGDVVVQVALKLLTQALQGHAPTTPKGAVIMKAISSLTKEFAQGEDKAQELMPAELKAALSGPGGMPSGGGPRPGM